MADDQLQQLFVLVIFLLVPQDQQISTSKWLDVCGNFCRSLQALQPPACHKSIDVIKPRGSSTGAAATGKSNSKAAKAAAKQDKRNAKLKEQRAKEAAEGKKVVPKLQSETEQFSKAIKGVKSRMRELMQQGLTAKAAKSIAQKAVTGE